MCWSCSVLVREARYLSWCDTAPPARGNLLLAFDSFNFHKHFEGGTYVEVCVGRASCWFVRPVVCRGVTRHLRHEGTSYSPSARLIFVNILNGGIGRSVCWSWSMLVRAARCPSWCDTAPPARGNLLLAFGSFNFHKHLEGGHMSKCVLVVQRASSSGALFVVV